MASESSFVASNVSIEVEGDITVPGAPDEDEEPSTLDEPVLETLVSTLNVLKNQYALSGILIKKRCFQYFLHYKKLVRKKVDKIKYK